MNDVNYSGFAYPENGYLPETSYSDKSVNETKGSYTNSDSIKSNESQAWPHLNREIVSKRLLDLKIDPNKLNQGCLGLCGEATFLRHYFIRDPIRAHDSAIMLLDTGACLIGDLYIKPRTDLLNADYNSIKKEWSIDKDWYNKSGASDLPPQADWMMISSLCSSENSFFHFKGTPNEEIAWGRYEYQLKNWYINSKLYTGVEQDDNLDLNHVKTIFKTVNNHICVGIDSSLIDSNSKGGHFIALESNFYFDLINENEIDSKDIDLNKIDLNDKVIFDYWSWGQNIKTCTTTVDKFKKTYQGAIICSF